MNGIVLSVLLTLVGQASSEGANSYTTEQLAVGAIREIISAQAVRKQQSPEAGYACALEPLIEADLLGAVWLDGGRLDGYAFELWCEGSDTPQTTFRASAVPVKKGEGSTLTVCTDETNVPRTVEGTVGECFAKGAPPTP